MSDKETAPTISQLALEIRNLAHLAWTDPKNAEYLFSEIEGRAKEISAIAVESRAPAPQPPQRSDKDYAIEHAEYLAKSVEHYQATKNAFAEFMESADRDRDEEMIDQFRSDLSESWRGMNFCIFEFRKRANRVATTPQVTEGNLCTGDQDCRHACELELEQEADGRWIAEFLRFTGVMAYGKSPEEAIWNAAKVLIESEQASPRSADGDSQTLYLVCGHCKREFARLALIHCGGGGRTVKTRKKVERFVEVVPVDETFPDVSHSELRLIDAVTMQAALVQLAADQQMAVTACDLKGYTTYEYARQIGVPRSTVVGRLRRGHVHLKAILGSTADMPSTAG